MKYKIGDYVKWGDDLYEIKSITHNTFEHGYAAQGYDLVRITELTPVFNNSSFSWCSIEYEQYLELMASTEISNRLERRRIAMVRYKLSDV